MPYFHILSFTSRHLKKLTKKKIVEILTDISLQLKAAEIGYEALKAVHGSEYTVGCTPCLLCKYLY